MATLKTKRAKILDDTQFREILGRLGEAQHPERDRVIFILSFKAGLRSQEIAGLDWEDVTDAKGNIGAPAPGYDSRGRQVNVPSLFIPGDIAKKGRERSVALHPDLIKALRALQAVSEKTGPKDPVITGEAGQRLTPNYLAQFFLRRFRKFGMQGASSHSGRRTFITKAAQMSRESEGVSLRDVQQWAGHAFLSTTEAYIEPSPSAHALISRL